VAAIEKPGIEVLFELLDLKSHRGLRHEQDICRLGERQLFGNRMKYLQAAISHDVSSRIEYVVILLFNHKRPA
jgi:hypothetical protein